MADTQTYRVTFAVPAEVVVDVTLSPAQIREAEDQGYSPEDYAADVAWERADALLSTNIAQNGAMLQASVDGIGADTVEEVPRG